MANENNYGGGIITATVLAAGFIGIFWSLECYRPVRRISIVGISDSPVIKKISRSEGYEILGQFIYGEVANQHEDVNGDGRVGDAREAVGKTITNRVGREGYRDTLEEVIMADSRYTCVGSKKNKNWEQATGKLERNKYEERIYQECLKNAIAVLEGKDIGYKNQDDWIAYFDKSTSYKKVCKLNPAYWKTLRPDVTIGDLTFCVPRIK